MISLAKKLTKEYENIKEYYYQDIPANNIFPIIDQSPINFEIAGLPGIFIDPQEIYISLELNLSKPVGDTGGYVKIGEDVVALEQVPLYTIFKDITVAFNHEEVESSHGNYPYKTYMSLLLSTSQEARKCLLSSAMWEEDAPGTFDSLNLATRDISQGNYDRNRITNKGVVAYLRGRFLVDTLQVDKPILDKVSLSFTLYPCNPNSCLISPPGGSYLVQINRCFLTVGRIIPKNPKIVSMNYNFLRHVIKKIPHPKQLNTISPIVLARGLAPKYVTIGLVTEDSLDNIKKARFNFGAHFLNNITLKIGWQRVAIF